MVTENYHRESNTVLQPNKMIQSNPTKQYGRVFTYVIT
jgi:hypothetical protein